MPVRPTPAQNAHPIAGVSAAFMSVYSSIRPVTRIKSPRTIRRYPVRRRGNSRGDAAETEYGSDDSN